MSSFMPPVIKRSELKAILVRETSISKQRLWFFFIVTASLAALSLVCYKFDILPSDLSNLRVDIHLLIIAGVFLIQIMYLKLNSASGQIPTIFQLLSILIVLPTIVIDLIVYSFVQRNFSFIWYQSAGIIPDGMSYRMFILDKIGLNVLYWDVGCFILGIVFLLWYFLTHKNTSR